MFYLIDPTLKVKSAYKSLTEVAVNGFRPVEIPPNVDIDPTDRMSPDVFTYDDLIRQKYEGVLAVNAEFNSILYDDLLDSSVWDLANSSSCGVGIGDQWVRGTSTSHGALRTITLNLPGPSSRFKVVWNAFTYSTVVQDGFTLKYYTKVPSDLLQVSLSTDNANAFVSVFNDEPITLPPGDDIRIEFRSPHNTTKYHIGSFALLY